MLYVVPTPIGNLEDITLRAINVLKESDVVVAEDTRRTGILLKYYGIPKKEFLSFNDHNMKRQTVRIIELLKEGKKIALTSDAGTPGISDPGFYIIREAIKESIEVISLPGPTAAITALVGSGLPMDKFFFYGFLPKTKGKRFEALRMAENKEIGSVIYYESPHRIQKTLDLLSENFPEMNICIARELSKKFEEYLRGTPEEIIKNLEGKTLKGEIVLILSSKK